MTNVLKMFFYSLIVILFIRCNNYEKHKEERPNVLFILVDDHRNDVISAAGHPIVKTPTVDKLAKNGIMFSDAFVTTPICAASRASIFTGLYESKHNYTFGRNPIKKEFITSENLKVHPRMKELYKFFKNNGKLIDISDFDQEIFHIFSRKVLKMITDGEEGWQEMLPEGVAETIVKKRLFGYSKTRKKT